MIFEGDTAPDHVLVTCDAEHVDLRAPGIPLVLFFYQEAESPASTNLVKDFEEHRYEFDAVGVRVIGVGVDGVERTEEFAARASLHFKLVDDGRRELCRAFEVLDRATGRPRPATFLIDTGGVVRRVFPSIPPYGHAHDVLEACREVWG